ncbi:LPXTG cell wall anchor domain-containing protein [Kitasatospora indigofera]|uniref:LPXTG cell wall anchor domain-containing protein n=1 Tax=Kitasatospora indigofera TaxID=67307 RepID=UPI003639FF7E
MSIRRSLALAGSVALASSIVLGGAQGALAVGSASPSATAAAQAEKAGHKILDLSVKGVPNEFFAGGEAREFTFTIDNSTGHDFAFVPLLKFKDSKGKLHAADFKAEYQLPKTTAWLPTVPPPGVDTSGDDAGLTALAALTPEGELTDDSVLYVAKGTNVTIKVRVSFTKDAPLGKAAVVPVVVSAELDDTTHEPNGDGVWSCDQIKGAGFTIKAPKPVPSPSASTTKPSTSPSPSATVTTSPSATTSPSTSASPSATATQSSTPTTPATTAATSPAASTSAPVPSASATDSTPVDFPVNVPTVTPPKITDAAVSKAKAKADAAGKDLAATGGGSDSTPIAIAGGAVLAAGIGTLVVLRRRKTTQGS